MDPAWASASEVAAAVNAGTLTATSVVEEALAIITARDPLLNAFTSVTDARARKRAEMLDSKRAQGEALGPLAGVPFAVKNLFDVKGLSTLAGSKINRDLPPASRDAPLIERLEAAGAVLVGALNMGEYAYDFTGENVHYGPSRNPHDLNRMTGGSSGGSGGAVGGGLVPLALGSDTNGSIRVPSSLCGIFGPRNRTFPFVASIDHLGPFARSAHDLALAYDAMQGADPEDPVCVARPAEPATNLLERGADGLRIAVAGGYFQKGLFPEAHVALDQVAAALHANDEVELPQAALARSAAYLISTIEGASLHLERIRKRANDFDPAVRDRFIAAAMVPGALAVKAQKFRRWFQAEMLKLFERVDVILAPATPCTAPEIGEDIYARRCRDAGARESGRLYSADLVHRPTGGRGADPARAAADRSPDHRGALA